MAEKLVLIDGHSILNRAFYGVPDLSNAKGLHTNAIFGFLNILFKILEEERPDYLAVAFDVHAPTFRHEMYEGYKGTRKPMPEELRQQVPVMKEVLQAMQITIMEQAGLEADDILGTLARKAESEGMEVSLVSGDRDLLQIATEHIKIRIPKTKMGRTEIEDYYAEDVKALYQVTPTQFIELKALMGDASDNIPGVPKVGEKTAIALMTEYGSIDNIYAHLEEIGKKSIRESLAQNRELADLSKKLATIRTDCDLTLDYQASRAEGFYTPEAYQMFKRLEFKNILSRFDLQESDKTQEQITEGFHLLRDSKQMVKELEKLAKKSSRPVGLLALLHEGRLAGVAVSDQDRQSYFYCGEIGDAPKENQQLSLFDEVEEKQEDTALAQAVRELTARCQVYTLDIKGQYGYYAWEKLGENPTKNYFDAIIGAYLLNPLKNDYDGESVAAEYLDLTVPGYKECFGKKSLAQAAAENLEQLAVFYQYQAYTALQAGLLIRQKLEENGMGQLMREVEMPLSLVLHEMEQEGVAVRRQELKSYGDALTDRIQELEESIHKQAGCAFNINSPKQLGEILFDQMKLPGGKKTKSGYSTAADVLEKLAPEHPIIADILEYRGLTKLKSTYADGLAEYIDASGRIHTNFNQTITATGRISSTEPNLQNIPMRMELGRRIRKVFVPREGCVLTDADYSQIELRVLAHMSGDEELIQAYHMDQDIHRITASKVFKTPFEEVTDLQRRNAKAVNFGIVYGISSFGLSQDLSISKKEAAEYIEQYFATYPKVKEYLDRLVAYAKEKGYTATMYGRRRPIPELSSSNFMQRSFGERVAMNSPIQGTAADIIKIAMIRVWKELRRAGLASRLILQVHDELVIETRKEETEQVGRILEESMKGAAQLAVPLEVDLHTGENWYEAH
ncbi:MAG: DNA polymerase I [bacterium]|nr:DNA polymerase I [bacterium]MCM1375934.1 DNA polymerase I [Muribaculum sp.]